MAILILLSCTCLPEACKTGSAEAGNSRCCEGREGEPTPAQSRLSGCISDAIGQRGAHYGRLCNANIAVQGHAHIHNDACHMRKCKIGIPDLRCRRCLNWKLSFRYVFGLCSPRCQASEQKGREEDQSCNTSYVFHPPHTQSAPNATQLMPNESQCKLAIGPPYRRETLLLIRRGHTAFGSQRLRTDQSLSCWEHHLNASGTQDSLHFDSISFFLHNLFYFQDQDTHLQIQICKLP